MKTKVIKTEVIKATDYSEAATVLTLNQAPSFEEEKELFSDDSIVLEF